MNDQQLNERLHEAMKDPEYRDKLRAKAEEFEKNPYPKNFDDFNWYKISTYLGGGAAHGFNDVPGRILILSPKYGLIAIHDNGGEINLQVERPVFTREQLASISRLGDLGMSPDRFLVRHPDAPSVPYTSCEGYVTNVALAYRILMFIKQEPIDWDWNEPDPETIRPYQDPVTQLGPEEK